MDNDNRSSNDDKNSFVEANQEASNKNALIGESEIKKYDEVNPEHSAFEDIPEIQSTDDV